MADRRPKPYLYATWMSKIMSDSFHCNWSVWFRTHHYYEKLEFDMTKKLAKHNELRRRTEEDLVAQGFSVRHEPWWKIEGQRMDFGGRCDMIGIRDDGSGRGVICELKGGRKYDSDRIQLMLYMWALPKSSNEFKGVSFDGLLVYENDIVTVPAVEIDEDFHNLVKRYTIEILDKEPSARHPSYFGCQYCNIKECEERISEKPEESVSDYRPDFF